MKQFIQFLRTFFAHLQYLATHDLRIWVGFMHGLPLITLTSWMSLHPQRAPLVPKIPVPIQKIFSSFNARFINPIVQKGFVPLTHHLQKKSIYAPVGEKYLSGTWETIHTLSHLTHAYVPHVQTQPQKMREQDLLDMWAQHKQLGPENEATTFYADTSSLTFPTRPQDEAGALQESLKHIYQTLARQQKGGVLL